MKKSLLWLCVIWFIVNLLQSFTFPLIDDEAYYWVWSQCLDWGYFDHPPMVAWWVKIGFSIFQNTFGVRLMSLIFGTISIYILGLLFEPKNKKQFYFFVLICASFVLLNVYQFITTPDSPLIFFTILYLFVLKKYLETNRWKYAIALGLCMAFLMYSKYHAFLVIAFTLLPQIFYQIKNPKIYASILVGMLFYTPHLLWQQKNDWVSFQYHLFDRIQNEGFEFRFVYEYILNLLWIACPFLLYHFIKANIKFKSTEAFHKSMRWMLVGIIAFFLISSFSRATQPQWVVVALIPFVYFGFHYYSKKETFPKSIFILGVIGSVFLLIARVLFLLPNPPIKTPFHGTKKFMTEAGKLSGLAVFEKYQETSFFNFYNYPTEKAANYVTLANRKSQYWLWDSEELMNHEKITYISKYAKSWPDSIVWENNKNTAYHYKSFDSTQVAHKIYFNVLDVTNIKDSVQLKIKISNQHQRKISFHRYFKTSVSYSEGRHKTLYRQPLFFNSIQLKPKSDTTVFVAYKQTKEKGEFKAYIGLNPIGLPPKKQSNWFTVIVK